MSLSLDLCHARVHLGSHQPTICQWPDLLNGEVGRSHGNRLLGQVSHLAGSRRIDELQHRPWVSRVTTFWIWRILADQMLHLLEQARGSRNTQLRFSATSALNVLHVHITYDRIYGHIPTRDLLCVRYVERRLPDSMIANATKAFTVVKRSLSAKANSTLLRASSGVAEDGLPELMLWVGTSDPKLGEYVSNRYSRKKEQPARIER